MRQASRYPQDVIPTPFPFFHQMNPFILAVVLVVTDFQTPERQSLTLDAAE